VKHRIGSLALLVLLAWGCATPEASSTNSDAQAAEIASARERTIVIASPDEAVEFFTSVGFWGAVPPERPVQVPRAFITRVGPRWKTEAAKRTVEFKKEMFFRALAPLVLRANELILADRERLATLHRSHRTGDTLPAADREWLTDSARRYKAIHGEDGFDVANESLWQDLLQRVDMIPAALALGQGAYESAYGTSRFAGAGNALFGEWTWGKGITPEEQRSGKGNYKIAAFDSPLESVTAYMNNLNSHTAYASLRKRRAELRRTGAPLTGPALAPTLDRYSEKGEEYVRTLLSIMGRNGLEVADDAVLRDEPVVWLTAAESE
jgi:uncharacterized FlgJ-related protein